MGLTWKTKYGVRRVRVEPPTIEEAIFAAEGFTHAPEDQIRIAAALMQLPVEQVRARVRQKAKAKRHLTGRFTVAVEHKAPRRTRVQRA
jgi:hypothetical protein